jgi:hypothetical protein
VETAKHNVVGGASKVTYKGEPAASYGTTEIAHAESEIHGVMHRPTIDLMYGSQHVIGAYGEPFGGQPQHIAPVFVTQDQSAWQLQEMASRLYELLSKITAESGFYQALPDTFAMPAVPTRITTLHVVQKEPTQFRFIED